MNKVILVGRLTRDPELRFAAGSGNAVARFSLAVTRQFKRDEADFINCVSFGKQAETIAQYLTKGRQISLVGSLRTGSYDAQDGSKRYTTDVVVENFEFIGGKGNTNTNGQNNSQISSGFDDDLTPVDDGDMPF
ncbi:single-stranded DNA-binding protein [Clostridium thermobutyricum]|uniref:Single-stranded DNA-binding protein n=2 Tax=Clostridium thermobutyricum TaxID=29372 RepID=N9W8V4_9CLOT|nr:single-stranded DNA-binding protein [Clostridium thermobutyricum]ENY99475.1 single-stranded DNA-binding protein [Clostridium thermobutyricum]OPX44902.1 single-stranded DNA-binding protein A [Clostridium thermobutyricum DSM 4928]